MAKKGCCKSLPFPPHAKPSHSDRPSLKTKTLIDHASRELLNAELGIAGELLVVSYEFDLLAAAGRRELARKIVHVAQVEGDTAGYDIKSFRPDGQEKYIEVKTTRGSPLTPFFITQRELKIQHQNPSQYFLYRLYDFNSTTNSARSFVVNGEIDSLFHLVPTEFTASLK